MNTVANPDAIDVQTYSLLQELMGDDGFQEIINVFREDTLRSVEHLAQAIQHEQSDVVGGICHRLKSSSKLVGALELADLVTELEHYRQHHDTARAQRIQTAIQQELERVIDWLDQQLVQAA